ncbi:MAG: ABC transporter substrate-binding protein [Hyphomicrobium sp.]|nr:ABC transporter substrate-binding protein [Hyphomicrobium sp.]
MLAAIVISAGALALHPAAAQDKPAAPDASAAAPAAKDALTYSILYVRQTREKPAPLSLLDLPSADDGIAGAKLAISDNNTTGKFLNQSFKLDVIEGADAADLSRQALEKITAGTGYIIADMEPDSLLKFSDALAGKPALIANVGSADDSLREENCRANVLHVAPTRTMLADALGQYLSWKQWRNWFLVSGSQPDDKAFAEALRRAAKRFGSKIVEEREFKYQSGSRRSDGGFEQIQQQIPQFTQNAKDHDVVVVADESGQFGDYMPYRTWTARPVAGTSGLTATSWHPALELWGGTQFQNRFRRLTNRLMTPLDYDAWLAVRVIGEAASRKQTTDFKTLSAFIHAPEFEVAAFKGVKTTFRNWNGQLRQPLIVTTPKLLVSISPQPGFLHQFTELDTLGIDKPETKCKAYAQ